MKKKTRKKTANREREREEEEVEAAINARTKSPLSFTVFVLTRSKELCFCKWQIKCEIVCHWQL